MERAIDVTGRPVDPATASDIVQTVGVFLRRKAGSKEGIPDTIPDRKSSLLP
jgi:hypothetical protein